jgi:hypothetical protein
MYNGIGMYSVLSAVLSALQNLFLHINSFELVGADIVCERCKKRLSSIMDQDSVTISVFM